MPNKPENLTQSFVNSNQISVQWSAPSGHVDKYRLTLKQYGSIVTILTIDGTNHSFIDLMAGTQYFVDVESKSGNLFSEAVNLEIMTSTYSESFFTLFCMHCVEGFVTINIMLPYFIHHNEHIVHITFLQNNMSQCMRFPTIWYVRPAKPQTSLRIRAV